LRPPEGGFFVGGKYYVFGIVGMGRRGYVSRRKSFDKLVKHYEIDI
jgi:hypothetical protein